MLASRDRKACDAPCQTVSLLSFGCVKKKRTRQPTRPLILPREELDVFREDWLAYSPAERLKRSWALRKRLRDPRAVHDAKLFPKP